MNKDPTSRLFSHYRIPINLNSGPLSERICLGNPRVINSFDKANHTQGKKFPSHNHVQDLTIKFIYELQNTNGSIISCSFRDNIISPNMSINIPIYGEHSLLSRSEKNLSYSLKSTRCQDSIRDIESGNMPVSPNILKG